MNCKRKNILVTGSSGFVGVNLVPYLSKESYKVIGITRRPKENEISYNELDSKIWNESYAMIHLAGKAHDLKKTADDQVYYEVNRDLTCNLFDEFLNSTCQVFIYISSVKAVKDVINEPLTEQHTPTPITVYGKSKLEAEKYMLSKQLPEEKRLIILRPCMIHGPNNKGNLNLLFKFVSKGIPYPLGAYNNLRSFVSIDNFCFVIEKILNKKINSGIYNMSDDQSMATTDLIQLMGKIINRKVHILNISKSIIWFLGKFGDLLKLPFNSERIEKLTENYEVDNSEIKKALKIENLPLTSDKGLEKTIKSFQ